MIVCIESTAYSVALMAAAALCVASKAHTHKHKQTDGSERKKKRLEGKMKHFGKKGRWILFTTHTLVQSHTHTLS